MMILMCLVAPRDKGNISIVFGLLVAVSHIHRYTVSRHIQVLFVLLLSTAFTVHAQTAFRKLTFTTLRNPEPGYYFVEPNASDSIGFLDNSGLSVCKYAVGIRSNVQAYNNRYITHFVPSLNGNPYFLRRDRFLSVIDTMRPTATYRVDFHEGKVWSDTTYLVLASENRIMNLSGIVQGGSSTASVIGAVIQERRFSDGVVVFEWKSLDHIPVTDATDDIKLTDNLIDYIHVNSVSKDVDGNLIVSCRHTDEVIKIRKSTGEVLWRLGGSASKGNQFTFINDTFNNFSGFSHQHSAIRTKSGNILLFDNGNLRPLPNYARAVEYALDTVAMTATRVWTWQPALGVIASSQGSVQELDGGNILIGWGSGSDTYVAHEVRKDGTIEAEIRNETGTNLIPYRVSKMQIGMTGVRKRITTTGTHAFSSGDSTTHVRLSLARASDTTSIVVERHHYAPHNISFAGEVVCGILPTRWTVRVREPQNVAGSIIFDLGSIASIAYPELAQIYHRPVEGEGAFTRLAGTYSNTQQTFTTNTLVSGEFLVSYAECLDPSPVKPVDAAVEVSTTPTLGWTAAVAAERYDVQVSTSSSFNTILHSATTADLETTLPLLQESSVLYWRVRKNDSRGAGPWSKSARFTVVMGVPTLLAPVTEDDTLAVLPGTEFRWIPGAGTAKSRLQILAVGSNVATVDTILDQPVFTPGSLLRPNTWYRWSVRGWVDDVNGRSSTPATFITAVASPRLRGPGSNATGVPPVKSTFSWDTVAGAVSYTVMVRNADDNSLVGVYESTAEKVDVRNLPASTVLVWTCRGNSEYGPGPYAPTSRFTTAASSKLPAPLTVAPRGGAEVDTTSVTLQWSSVDGATVYDVQYSTSPVFAENVTSLFDRYDTQVRIGPLRSATAIYWRVLARSDFSAGTWSDTALFVTEAAPGSGLMPLSPAAGLLDVPIQGSVTYTTSSMYSSYRVEFSKTSTFDPIVSTFLSTSGSCSYKDLDRETTYFWRVRGLRDGSSQDVGSASFFTTLRKDVVSVDEQQSQQTCRVWGDGSLLQVEHSDETVTLLTVDVFDIHGRCVQRITSQRARASMLLDHVSASQVLIVLVTTDRGHRSTVLHRW